MIPRDMDKEVNFTEDKCEGGCHVQLAQRDKKLAAKQRKADEKET